MNITNAEPQALLVRAAECVRRGQLQEAELAVRALLDGNPAHVIGQYLLADILRQVGRDADSLEGFSRALVNEFAPGAPAQPWSAARLVVDVIARAPIQRWQARAPVFSLFGTLLARAQPAAEEPALEALAASPIATLSPGEFPARFAAAAAALGFEPQSPRDWNRVVFERIALPWMQRALAADCIDQALTIEGAIYSAYVKQTENEAHFRECFARWKDDMRAAGRRFAATLPAIARAGPGPLPRVAFFAHNVTSLAHIQMLLAMLEGHAQLAKKRFEPHLFYLSGDPLILERFRRAGVVVEGLFEAGRLPSYRSALALLRQRVAEKGVDELVWISLALMMTLAFAMRLAPAQSWWAMKYHSLETPEIDGYITGGGLEGGTKTIAGRAWRAGPVAGSEWTVPERGAEALAIRRAIGPWRVFLGSFGREEKLDSPAFLDAVARILKAVPDAAFLWTGRTRHAGIQQRLEAAGVADRCRHIGWVDTKLYAQVIDIFLDSFPFPCGFTLYEAMAAGKAPVLYQSADSADTGANALIGPLLDSGDPGRDAARLARSIFRPGDEDLCLRATDPDQYVALATRLATDDAFRARVGDAYRRFVTQFMADRARAAGIYADHFEAILSEASHARAA